MKVAVKKDGHNFYTHINQVVSAKPPPKPQDKESNSIKEDVKGKDVAPRVLIL